MRTFLLIGLIGGALIGVDPFGWDEVGPVRWLLVSTSALAVVATTRGAMPRDRLVLLWGALIVWLGVSAVFGVDRFHAWVGTPDRHFGWLTWLVCGALFVVARRERSPGHAAHEVSFVTRAVVVASLIGAGIAVAEAFGWSLAETEFAGGRLGGAFSQPALLGAASVLTAPIAAAVGLDQKEAAVWRALGWIALAGSLFSLLGSQTRGAWAAMAVVFAVVLIVHRSGVSAVWRRAQPLSRGLLGAVVAGSVALAVWTVPVMSRLRAIGGSDGGLAGRVDEWQVAARALADRPIIGWGPEGYRIAFGAHVDVDYVVAHSRQVITDRAHSGPLDVAVVGGLPGGLLYVAILVLLGIGLWRVVGAGEVRHAGMALGVLGYFTQQLVLFPVAELDPLVWFLAGLALADAGSGALSSPAPTMSGLAPVVRGVAAGLAVVAALAGALDVAADHRVKTSVSAADPDNALAAADGARALRGESIRYDFIASRVAARSGGGPSSIDAALIRVDNGLTVSPNDPALRGERARQLLERALTTGDTSHVDLARATLEALVVDDPHHPEHIARLGIARAVDGDDAAAEAAFRLAIRLDPENADHQRNLATLLESRKSS